jgi:HAD superfamily hydrolase (TIGR01484 family)
MPENIEAAWFDIDGTLKQGTERPTHLMLNAFSRIRRRGINTARSIRSVEEVISPSEVTIPSIVLTGGEVWEPGGELIKSFPLDAEEKSAIADLIVHDSSIKAALFYPEGKRQKTIYASTPTIEMYYYQRDWKPIDQMTQSNETFAGWLEGNQTSKIVLKFWDDEPTFPDNMQDTLSIDRPSEDCITITRSGVNKGTTLLWICDYLNIDPRTVLTAGDTDADVEAFRHTQGIGVGDKLLPYSLYHVANPDELAHFLMEIAL